MSIRSLRKRLRRSLLRRVTSFTGMTSNRYQKYSDFEGLTPEQIIDVPLDEISTTNLDTDTKLHNLTKEQKKSG